MQNKQIKVMVVDDSVFMRTIITNILESNPDIKVIATASNGKVALKLLEKEKPDVITLDIEMPQLNGIETLKIIQRNYSIPVVMISSLTTAGAKETFQALELGAVDFIGKPSGSISRDIHKISDEIIEKVSMAAKAKTKVKNLSISSLIDKLPKRKILKSKKIVVIGISTGGPKALKEVIPLIPGDLPVPILVVQHMPALFTSLFAQRLDNISFLKVKEAEEGELIVPGQVYVAPGDYHMCLSDDGKFISLNKEPSVWGVRPAADFTLGSAAKAYKQNVISVIMTGMGHDGINGVKAVKKLGGYCIAQDEESCTVYGMPKTVIEAGLADKVVPLSSMASEIFDAVYN